MVYARDSKSRFRKELRVQVPPMAPRKNVRSALFAFTWRCLNEESRFLVEIYEMKLYPVLAHFRNRIDHMFD